MSCRTCLEERLVYQAIIDIGLYCRGYRYIGESFIEFEIVLCSGCDFRQVIYNLKALGFYELRIDGDDQDAITATMCRY